VRKYPIPSHPLHKTIHHPLFARVVELDGQLVAVHGGDVAVAEFLGRNTRSRGHGVERDPSAILRFSAAGPHGDFDILIERGQHSHQALQGKALIMAAQDIRQVGLLDADQLRRRDLRQLPRFDEPVKLHDERSLQQMFLGVRQAEIGEDIAASDVVGGQGLFAHDLTS
jgi:hypothetical protein